MSETIYLKMKKKVQVSKYRTVTLQDVCDMVGDNSEALLNIALPISFSKSANVIVDCLDIVQIIKRDYNTLKIEIIGNDKTIVTQEKKEEKPNVFLVILVFTFLFMGAGLAIMNFHTDVSMFKVHQRIYELVTGVKSEDLLILQIPYSIGIGIGMLVFFNHFFQKKFSSEPSPMDIELYLYQDNIDKYIGDEEDKKSEKKDE